FGSSQHTAGCRARRPDAVPRSALGPPTGPAARRNRVLLVPRQRETELGSAARAGLDPDPAAHRGDQPAADIEPDARARGRAGGLWRAIEQLEQSVGLVRRDADPAIEDAGPDP